MVGASAARPEMFFHQLCSALLSRKNGKPVRMEYAQEEDLTAIQRRPPIIIELRTGIKKDGTLVAAE